MDDDSFPSLAVDEQLLFVALTTLADIEGREQPFELLNVIREFSAHDAVTSRFSRAVGRAIATDDRDAIDYYVGAVYLLHHHRANLDQLPEALKSLEPEAQQFVRTASWTFLQAWSLRYGGLHGRLVSRGSTLIDPTIDSVK
jgi:hypothetical protein